MAKHDILNAFLFELQKLSDWNNLKQNINL